MVKSKFYIMETHYVPKYKLCTLIQKRNNNNYILGTGVRNIASNQYFYYQHILLFHHIHFLIFLILINEQYNKNLGNNQHKYI